MKNNNIAYSNDPNQGKSASNVPYTEYTVNYACLFGGFIRQSSVDLVSRYGLIGRLYEVYAKSGDTYLVHFVPVKRKNDNVLGFYEMVSGQFFTNMDYQSNFTAGPAV